MNLNLNLYRYEKSYLKMSTTSVSIIPSANMEEALPLSSKTKTIPVFKVFKPPSSGDQLNTLVITRKHPESANLHRD